MKILKKIAILFFVFLPVHFVSFPAGNSVILRLQPGWKNYSSEYQPAMVKKDALVCVVQGTVMVDGKKNCLIAKLPAAYCPAYTRSFSLGSNDQNVRVDVTTKGEIIFVDGTLSKGLLSLNGIIFSTGDGGLGDLTLKKTLCLLNEPLNKAKNYAKEKKYRQTIFGTLPYSGPQNLFGKPVFFKGEKLCILQGMVQEGSITIDYPIRMYFDILAHKKITSVSDIYAKKLETSSHKNVPVKFFMLTDEGTIDCQFGGSDGLLHVPYLGFLPTNDTFPLHKHIFCATAQSTLNRVDVGPEGFVYWADGARKSTQGMPLESLSLSGIVYAVDQGSPLKLIYDFSENYGKGYCPATCGTDGDFCWIQGCIKLYNKRFVPASEANYWKGTLIAKLPDKFPRPAKRLCFRTNAGNVLNRVDILPDGEIRWICGQRPVDWLSLSGIVY